MTIHRSVRHWRLTRGLSQQMLAQRSGISQGAISLIEQGKQHDVTLKTVGRLAQALNVEPRELMVDPPREALRVTRLEREAVAHAVVEGTSVPPNVPPDLVFALAGVVTQKLRGFNAPGAARNRGRRWRVQCRWYNIRARYGEALIVDLLHRIDTELLRRG